MAALGELVVSLSANIAQFTSAMEKAAYEAEQKSKRMERAFAAAESAIKALGVAAGGAVLARMITNAADVADQMGKMSARTGVATETLSGYAHAAALSDVSNEDLQASLVKLNVKMGEARDGSKEAQAALARFGIDANLDGPAQAFEKIAERVKNTGDAAAAASALNDVFGRSFANLIPLLQGGEQGLKDAADEARALGVEVGENFSIQAQQFNDNLTRMQTGLQGISLQISAAVMPMLVQLTDEIVGTGKEMGQMSVPAGIVKTVLETLIVVGSEVSFVFQGIGRDIGGIAAQAAALARLDFTAVGDLHQMMIADADEARAKHDAFIAAIMNPPAPGFTRSYGADLDALKAKFDAGKLSVEEYRSAVEKLIKSQPFAQSGPSGPGIAPAAPPPPPKPKISRAPVDEFLQIYDRLTAKSAGFTTSFNKDLDTLYAGFQKGRVGVDDYRAAVEQLIQDQPFSRDLERQAQDAARKQEAMDREVENLRTSLLTEEEYIRESYERRQALVKQNTPAGSSQQGDLLARVQAEYETQVQAIENQRQRARDQLYQGLLTEEEQIRQSYERRYQQIMESTAIGEEERGNLVVRLRKEFEDQQAAAEAARMSQQLVSTSQFFGSLADLAHTYAGEQSGIYRALFAVSKAFAIADAAIKVQQAIAAAAASGPFPWNLAAMASVIAATSGLVSSIASIGFSGAYDAGGDIPAGKWGVVGERGLEIVHGPASVTGRQDTARLLQGLAERQSAAPPVVNVRTINLWDSQAIGDYMGSSPGEKIWINHARRNASMLRNIG